MMRVGRYALGVEYDGTAFLGWQAQPQGRSVQGVLEAALSRVADARISVVAAGRTDAGVHATGQVVHFEASCKRPPRAWVLGVNSNLPEDVAVRWATPVPEKFHARFSATARHYRYLVCERGSRPAVGRQQAAWTHRRLDVSAMQAAAECLLGEHDFSAFRAAECQAASPVRTLRRLDIRRQGELIVFSVTANAFLHHMVRNLVGSLLAVGRGEVDRLWLEQVLAGRDRGRAGPTAPAHGLTLTGVDYPDAFAVPPAQTSPPRELDEALGL